MTDAETTLPRRIADATVTLAATSACRLLCWALRLRGA